MGLGWTYNFGICVYFERFIFVFTAIRRTDVFGLVGDVCLVALCLVTFGGCLAMSTVFDGP